jgi:predicted TIM-barrel fold metal-dependent hydrolase
MIVDEHAHSWPFLGQANGHISIEDHMRSIQIHIGERPVPEKKTRRLVKSAQETLIDGRGLGASSLLDVNFRVGTCGRFEWTKDGVDYAMQILPVSLENTAMSLDRQMAQMDDAGVDKAVLHNARFYGFLNDYLAECVAQYPDRLVAVAQIHEEHCDRESEILELRRAVKDLGLRALHFQVESFFVYDYRDNLDDAKFNPFWEEVERLGIPVLWNIRPTSGPRRESYVDQIRRLGVWARRWPRIPSVFTHGVNIPLLTDDRGVVQLPNELWWTLEADNVFLELLFPIMQQGLWDYPFPEAQVLIRKFYERLGASKLMWGSDFPSAEVFVTYRQSLDYLRRYCDFIKSDDMDRVLGGNAASLYKMS